MTSSQTIDIPAGVVDELARERASAEAAAQRATIEAPKVEPKPEPKPAPAVEVLPEIDEDAHAAAVDMIAGMMVLGGGREVPAAKRALAAKLTYPAAVKYRGEVPYFAELLAVAGLGLLVHEAFFVKDEPKDEEPKSTPTAKAPRKAA